MGIHNPHDRSTGTRRFNTLINCAGVTQAQGLLGTSPTSSSLILRTNLEAPIELSRQLLKDYFALGTLLSKQPKHPDLSLNSPATTTASPSYCVINISSLLADRGGHGSSIYATSKAGLVAFTRTLALEAASIRARFPSLPAFRANVVAPGYVDTPMLSALAPARREELCRSIPLRRFAEPAEVAGAVLFLLANEYANNALVNLDGGLSAV